MAERRLTAGVLLCASLLLLGASGVETYSEVSPYFQSGFAPERRFLAISGHEYVPAKSLWSKEMYLRDCFQVSKTFYAKAQPTSKRQSFLQRCQDEAERISLAMPSYVRPWLVRADTASEMGEPDEFLAALRWSKRLAPYVHWTAEWRTRLADENFSILTADDLASYEDDVRTLLDSEPGAKILAQRYIEEPELRERLSRIAQSVPAAAQARFVRLIRSEANTVS